MKMREMKAARERRQTVEVSAIQEEIVTGKDHKRKLTNQNRRGRRRKKVKESLNMRLEMRNWSMA